jgi:hypothetical protein
MRLHEPHVPAMQHTRSSHSAARVLTVPAQRHSKLSMLVNALFALLHMLLH